MSTITKTYITDKINGISVNTSIKCNSANYNNKGSRDVKYIVMHYTGNSSDKAISNAKYFANGSRKASAHLFVDNDSIYQSVELCDIAWHCGTSGKYYHDSCRNANSFGIEMCTSGDYKISDTTQINAAYLCAYLCKLIGITADTVDTYVLRHYDITHKNCPAQYVSNPTEWTAFKTMVKNILTTGSVSSMDINNDGKVDANDALDVLKETVGLKPKTGNHNANDALDILKHVVGLDKSNSNTSNNTPTSTTPPTPTTSATPATSTETYTRTQFIKEVQAAIGAKVDGVAGSETLSKTVTVSKSKNNRHAVVKPIQKYLNAQGFSCGTEDGIAGSKFDTALKSFQSKVVGMKNPDGEATAKKNTWKKLLGL